jgi:UDP-N-acetylglucosamine--N-acetylmuramyl-(pentapeptide) pyrophosphoryl-undecaprenol N-acetylglucosamine transferase
MRIAIVAGGTGGHIYPGMAIGEEIKRRLPAAEILFIGSEEGLEKDLFADSAFKLKLIKARALLRKISYQAFSAPLMAALAFFQSLKILIDFRPRALISTGGYASLPVVVAAKILRIPVFIHEQNVFPGITNWLCRSLAEKIFLSFEAAPFPRGLLVGNPVRQKIINASREEAQKKLGIAVGKKMLLVMGGSQGARQINTTLLNALPQIDGKRWEIFHIVGKRDFNWFERLVDKEKYFFYRPFAYLYQMDQVLAAADLVISRAGATAMAEFFARGLPMILIPFPYSARGHQEANALAAVRGGAACLVKNDAFTAAKLLSLLTDGALDLEKMAAASKKMARLDAARRIVDELGL